MTGINRTMADLERTSEGRDDGTQQTTLPTAAPGGECAFPTMV